MKTAAGTPPRGNSTQTHTTVAHPSLAASLLFDVVVFAGGAAPGLTPLCDNEPKPMLCICNRPMIWYCLHPWITAGCQTFFVCVNEDYAALQRYLCREFPAVTFVFVLVPLTLNEAPSTTCDVVKAYLKHKESLKPDKLGQPRDALLLSCDTFLPGVNLEHFIRNFYCSVASASILLFRPMKSTRTATAETTGPSSSSSGGGGGKNDKSQAEPYKYRLVCTAYEEKDDEEQTNGLQKTKSRDQGNATNVHHHRLHFIAPHEEKPVPRISVGFASRRPNLTCTADTMDAHVYLVRDWVLHAMAEYAGEGMTVQRDIIPFLARSQHSTLNAEENVFLRPDSKIKYNIPNHWLYEKESFVHLLNACPAPVLPVEADNLLVCCTIYEEREDEPMRVYRVKTREDFLAVNREILTAKCDLHGLNEPVVNASNTQQQQQKQKQQQQKQSKQQGGKYLAPATFSETTQMPASAFVLSSLLPDSPFTLQMKQGIHQVQIKRSFLRSLPSGNVYITSSIIGSNVTLGVNARITNSVILDNAEIGANAIITNSIIGSSAMVNPGLRVVNCTVGPQYIVESNGIDSVLCTHDAGGGVYTSLCM
ncbi:GDP-mannose pyrophosphorylase [Trypanosoma theileri]|uniref:Translation initiation factor eIF2B subunit gamma n=1 Tax=Trypanosoma theileri TaxID=67003 RepID=A0A1X0NS55_9TRYP|nr:GDP-mannose pyrophosphorylase [Trypanosoma theileri]ORC87019.1 GDP-mannose pyrophosphorylase [Trypanosoma theileri]